MTIRLSEGADFDYQGANQDEVTFLEMAKQAGLGFTTSRDSSNQTSINISGVEEAYTILRVVEFTSERKKMSVAVKRESDGKVFNFVKGADVAIVPNLVQESKEASADTQKIMDQYAHRGLRTLLFAYKELEADSTAESLKDVGTDYLESDLTLVGVTGLEDMLQDQVGKCIKDFKMAKIKVWMITGDKGETAYNIGVACGLTDMDAQCRYNICEPSKDKVETQLDSIAKEMADTISTKEKIQSGEQLEGVEYKEYCLTIDGCAFQAVIGFPQAEDKLYKVMNGAESIIMFRCSPEEKA